VGFLEIPVTAPIRHARSDRQEEITDMIERLDALVRSYEQGRLNRRQLLQALASIAAPAAASAQTGTGPVAKGRMLHHINLQVADVARSEAFYRKLFGLGPSRKVQGPDNHGLDLAGGGLIILQKSDMPGRIDHFCVGVDQFDAARMRAAATGAGFERVQGTAADNFFVTDPDGIRAQVSAVDWSA
jgi:catechol 2,3-dioxygenase-like lactoylglutathione lyase family enzyme